MAVKIKLQRHGKIRNPQYRIVVADARTKRDGKFIEIIGRYNPKQEPSLIEVNSERARYWLGVGAQPTEPVAVLLKLTGDWQAHKGLPAPAEGVRTAAPKPDRRALFEAAAKQAMDEPAAAATTPRKKASKKGGGDAAAGAPAADAAGDATPAESASEG